MFNSRNSFYLVLLIAVLVITGTCEAASNDRLPFGLKWGQSKADVRQNAEISKPLKEKGNVLYYTVDGEDCTPATHFYFDKSDKLYHIAMVARCSDIGLADHSFILMQRMLEYSSSSIVIHSEGDLMYVYYNSITDSYILLNGFKEDGDYIVLLDYEQTKTSVLKKYDKNNLAGLPKNVK